MSDRICLGCRELRPREWFLDGRQPCGKCRGVAPPAPIVRPNRVPLDSRRRRNAHDDLRSAQGGRCAYCSVAMTKRGVNAETLDHIIPRALGGSNARHNLCLACEVCNVRKGHMTGAQYRRSPQLAARRRQVVELERRRLAHATRVA